MTSTQLKLIELDQAYAGAVQYGAEEVEQVALSSLRWCMNKHNLVHHDILDAYRKQELQR